MNHNTSFEIALKILAVAHLILVMLLLVTSKVCLAVIEAFDEASS